MAGGGGGVVLIPSHIVLVPFTEEVLFMYLVFEKVARGVNRDKRRGKVKIQMTMEDQKHKWDD